MNDTRNEESQLVDGIYGTTLRRKLTGIAGGLTLPFFFSRKFYNPSNDLIGGVNMMNLVYLLAAVGAVLAFIDRNKTEENGQDKEH